MLPDTITVSSRSQSVSLLAACCAMVMIPTPLTVIAWTTDAGGSRTRTRSLFTGTSISTTMPTRHYSQWSMYTNDQAPPGPDHNAWTVLSHTEEWISKTLNSANGNAGGGGTSSSSNNNNNSVSKSSSNPYARKEVSYVCENQTSSAMIVSNLFKWLRDARKQGEAHGEAERERRTTLGDSYKPSTMRQTQVVVIPSNPTFNSFFVFDELVNAMNQARRDARDLVTYNYDDDDDEEDDGNMWNIAINCAHMHPKYGERTIQQKIEELKALDAAGGEVDVNLEAYKAMRLAARRSPYPSIVIEVRATPTPDFGAAAQQSPAAKATAAAGGGQVSWEDIQKLEALFGKSAAVDKGQRSAEAAFWDQIGSQIKEVSSVTPTLLAQEWISRNLKDVEKATACITESSTSHVDSAYQFVFANIAMMEEEERKSRGTRALSLPSLSSQTSVPHFLVLSNFLSTSATSFEKFTFSISEMLNTIPELRQRLELSTYHPEHVEPSRRSPTPILSLSWRK